jgi:hypothetical protein
MNETHRYWQQRAITQHSTTKKIMMAERDAGAAMMWKETDRGQT